MLRRNSVQAPVPQTKLAIVLSAVMVKFRELDSTGALAATITAAGRIVVRKLDEIPEQEQRPYTLFLAKLMADVANPDVSPEEFRANIARLMSSDLSELAALDVQALPRQVATA